MRCSYNKKNIKYKNRETKEEKINYRILQDLNKHNWLLKKLKWQNNTSGKNLKNKKSKQCYLQKRKMSGIIKKNDLEYQIIDVDESQENADENTSTLPVSLPVLFFEKLNNDRPNAVRNVDATSGSNILENMTPGKNGNMVYSEVSIELKQVPTKGTSSSSNYHGNQSQLFMRLNSKQNIRKNEKHNIEPARNMHISEKNANNHSNKMALGRMEGFINQNQTCIKHNLPLATPPEREKYKIYENKAIGINTGANINGGNCFSRKPNYCNIGSQTDDVMFIKESEKKFIEFLRSHEISVEQMKKIITYIERKDVETSTDFSVNDNSNNGMMRDQVMSMLEACSFYNKEVIALNSKRTKNGSFPSNLDIETELIKLAYLRDSFVKVFGHNMFRELTKSYGENNMLDTNLPDLVPKKIANRKRRVSVPTAPLLNNTNNEDHATGAHDVPIAKKSPLRTQHRSPMLPPQLTYQTTPQLQPYQPMSEMMDAENNNNNNYINRNFVDPRNYTMNQQYQCPRPQSSQMEIPVENPLPFYQPGPRMMQPYAVQFTREQHTEYGNMSNNWNYPQQYPEVQNMRGSYMNNNPMSTRVGPQPDQRHYHHNQVHRNAVHNMSNYAVPNWNINMRPNGHM